MSRRRLNIAISLMVLAIVAIASFQVFWLVKNYKEEENNLKLKTNVLFRDAVFETQAGRLALLDPSFKTRTSGKVEAVRVINNIQLRTRDTAHERKEHMTIITMQPGKTDVVLDSLQKTKRVDTGRTDRAFFAAEGAGRKIVLDLSGSVDSIHRIMTVRNVDSSFSKLMRQEKLDVPYTISKRIEKPVKGELPIRKPLTLENTNEVTLGFQTSYIFRLDLGNSTAFLLKKLTSQILISLLLVGLTVMSFVTLLRNLIRQRKLTQLKNDFISNITHELKTPLATVSVAIEALKNFNALHDPQRTQEYLDISANELQRLSLLVDKVLKLSMFEKQEIELKYEWFDLKQLIREIVGSMRLQFEKFHAKVDIQLPEEEVNIKADRLHITSVIFNLLDNALKYAKTHPAVHVNLKEESDQVEFSVTDNGIGISTEFKDKIFEKFFRVPTGDKHNVKGYGLGLSYVNYVVQRHNGNIAVESQEGIGSRFIVKLPRA